MTEIVQSAGGVLPPIVWTESPLVAIPEKNPPELPLLLPLRELYAAKGESVSFQIGVQAPADGDLSNVTVTATDFVSVDTAVPVSIASSNIVLYREAYTAVNKDRPDPLIPFVHPENPDFRLPDGAPFAVSVGSRQPVWVDVNVPRGADAGTYQATFTITSNRPRVGITVRLTVWNFALPVQPTLKSVFLMRKAPTLFLAKELLRHRLMPKDEFALQPGHPDIIASALPELTDLGLNIAFIPVYGNQTDDKKHMDEPKSVADFQAAAAPYGRELSLLCYTADEIKKAEGLFPLVKAWAENLHGAGIRQLITVPPTPTLYCDRRNCTGESRRSAVDIWVLLPSQYDDASAVRHVRMKQDEVWSYNSVDSKTYRPAWHFDSPPIDFRIQPGFYNQALGLTGLLYWAVDYWKNGDRVWEDAMGGFARGDGVLTYPADRLELPGYAVPSIRLKWLRDGVNDFDYIELLKQIGRGDYAMSVVRQVARNWQNWTTPAEIEDARKTLGAALNDPANIPEIESA